MADFSVEFSWQLLTELAFGVSFVHMGKRRIFQSFLICVFVFLYKGMVCSDIYHKTKFDFKFLRYEYESCLTSFVTDISWCCI